MNVPVSGDQNDPIRSTRASAGAEVDLDAIERDLASVEIALGRLDDGTYFLDEVTGEALPDDVLAANPVARRVE